MPPMALAPLMARPAVYPTGPAARGYDAGDDMTTSRPLGCMHPWSSSVGRGDKGWDHPDPTGHLFDPLARALAPGSLPRPEDARCQPGRRRRVLP